MFELPQKKLAQVEELLAKEKYKKAFQIVETLEKTEELSSQDYLRYQSLRSRLLNKLGRFDEALALAEMVLKSIPDSKLLLQEIDLLLAKIEALYNLGRYDESLEVITKGEQMLNISSQQPSLEIEQRRDHLAQFKGNIFMLKGETDKALESLNFSLTLCKELDNKKGIARALVNLGGVYWYKGNYDQALDSIKQGLAIQEELDNTDTLTYAKSLYNISVIYWEKNDLDEALRYNLEALKFNKKLGNKKEIGKSLIGLANIYGSKGDLNRTLEYDQQSLVIFKEINNKIEIAFTLIRVGNTQRQLGELETALKNLEQSLAYLKELGDKRGMAFASINIGLLYWEKGELKNALKYLEQSLALFKETGNLSNASSSLMHLISVTLDTNTPEKSHYYLQQLKNINEQEQNTLIGQRYQIAEALVRKNSLKSSDKEKSANSLKKLINEGNLDSETTILALLHLCDIYLDDIDKSNPQEVLNIVRPYVNRLLDVANQQQSSWLLASSYILKTKITFIELLSMWSFEKIQEISSLLQRVQQLAQEKQLFIILARAHLLLALFYMRKMSFEEAKIELEKARKIINVRNLSKENKMLTKISEQIKFSETEYSSYKEILNQTFEKGEQEAKLTEIEQDFISSIDGYLQTIKIMLTQ